MPSFLAPREREHMNAQDGIQERQVKILEKQTKFNLLLVLATIIIAFTSVMSMTINVINFDTLVESFPIEEKIVYHIITLLLSGGIGLFMGILIREIFINTKR